MDSLDQKLDKIIKILDDHSAKIIQIDKSIGDIENIKADIAILRGLVPSDQDNIETKTKETNVDGKTKSKKKKKKRDEDELELPMQETKEANCATFMDWLSNCYWNTPSLIDDIIEPYKKTAEDIAESAITKCKTDRAKSDMIICSIYDSIVAAKDKKIAKKLMGLWENQMN
jgi:hypothetical protein